MPTSWSFLHALLRLAALFPGVYLFLALRRLYGESWRRLLAKVLLLGSAHLVALAFGLFCVGAWALFGALG